MVCAEDVVSYFCTLKSYERIWIMCKLQHCCLPFELRFLGTCLEELGKKDYNELRQAENEANSNSEANLSELHKMSDKRVRNKIILYLSLLHSRNYSCSNSLFRILCNCDEVNAFLKCESTLPSSATPSPSTPAGTASSAGTTSASATTADEEEDCFEHLLMIYTLAVNHPAFSCEQKQTLQNIFDIIRAEQNKRSSMKRNVAAAAATTAATIVHPLVEPTSSTVVGDNAVYNNPPLQMQECQPTLPNAMSPDTAYAAPPHLPNASHLPPVGQPFAHELALPLADQMSIGLPPPNFLRFPYPAGPWSAAGIPIVFTTAEPTNTTSHSFVSRSSSPSLSNSPSRSSSPSAKAGRPLSAPFTRSPQMGGPIPQPTSLPPPHVGLDPYPEMPKDISTVAAVLPGFASEQMDMAVLPNSGLLYATSMAVPATIVPNSAASHQCPLCHVGSNVAPAAAHLNGFVSELVPSCIDHDMSALRLDSDQPSRNSNSSNSEGTSSDHSSPPNTPLLVQNSYKKRNNKSGSVHEWDRGGIMGNSNNNNNSSSNNVGSNRTGGGGSSSSSSSSSSNNRVSNSKNNISNNNIININRNDRNSGMIDERSNAGDSSSEERTYSMASGYQGRGRIVNSGNNGSRGRSKNTNSYSRGRGNQRRRNESASSVSNEDVVRKTTTPFSMSSAEATPTAVAVASPFQYPAAVTAATVTNAAYLPPHLIRSYGSFPANSYIRSPYPAAFAPGAELIYPHHHHHHHHHHQRQYPPPPPPAATATTFLPGPIHYSTLVPPKLSCYNCGSQSHLANDCPESMLEEASKQGQYRLDFAPSADKSFATEK